MGDGRYDAIKPGTWSFGRRVNGVQRLRLHHLVSAFRKNLKAGALWERCIMNNDTKAWP